MRRIGEEAFFTGGSSRNVSRYARPPPLAALQLLTRWLLSTNDLINWTLR